MRCSRREGAAFGSLRPQNRHKSASKQTDPTEIGRYEPARDRAHSGPHARVPKGKGGGGVIHD